MKIAILSIFVAAAGLSACGARQARTASLLSNGGEETHGGDYLGSVFISLGYKVQAYLRDAPQAQRLLTDAELDRFAAALETTRVASVDGPIADGTGAVVDARTGPDPLHPGRMLVELDRERWEHLIYAQAVNRLVLHEYIWAIGGDDMNNVISKRLEMPADPAIGVGAWRSLTTLGAPHLDFTEFYGLTQTTLVGSRLVTVAESTTTASCSGAVDAHALDTAAGRWQPLPVPETFVNRHSAAAVALGDQLLLWGGHCGAANFFQDGVLVDPATGATRAISSVNAPSPRQRATIVARGHKAYVWGGLLDDVAFATGGGIYDADTDSWRPMATENAPEGGFTKAAWADDRLIVWRTDNPTCAPLAWFYDEAADRWTRLTAAQPSEYPCNWKDSVWMGDRFLLLFPTNETDESGHDTAGLTWSPTADRWELVSAFGAPQGRWDVKSVWNGKWLMVFGGRAGDGSFVGSGSLYDPARDVWATLSGANAPASRARNAGFATADGRFILWGGASLGDSGLTSGSIWKPH
jgi:hypothetical protein